MVVPLAAPAAFLAFGLIGGLRGRDRALPGSILPPGQDTPPGRLIPRTMSPSDATLLP